jgi:hypothetical protein
MAYNFKSIADVEVVAEPTESANVLIEEDGVIKKAPKTAVGGSDKEFDMIITCTANPSYALNGNITRDDVEITAGSFENILDAVRNKQVPNVKVILSSHSSGAGWLAEDKAWVYYYGSDYYINCTLGNFFYSFIFDENGDVTGWSGEAITASEYKYVSFK